MSAITKTNADEECDKLKNINKNKDKITSKSYHNKRQYQKSDVSNISDKKVYIASGLYPVDVRDKLIYLSLIHI